MKKKVLIAMSGGVDSSVAAYLLKAKNYRVVGATIKTWAKEDCEIEKDRACCSGDSIAYAKSVAHRLDIPHYVFDLSKQFEKNVINYFNDEYKHGRTPNPCILCNSYIKFGELFKRAEELGCEHIASGHYARIGVNDDTGVYELRKAMDSQKDQSYFLFNLKKHMLERILFPLGNAKKAEVRKIAKELDLKSHDRAASQDVCFRGGIFEERPGEIIFTSGKVLGRHIGVSHYTIGQRKGLGIAFREPLFVTGIDPKKNILYVGLKKDTLKKAITIDNVNWLLKKETPFRCNVKIRYRAKDAPAEIFSINKEVYRIKFQYGQSSPAPGQAAVCYIDDVVIGGGWVKDVYGK